MQFIKNGPDIPERLLQAHESGRVVFFCGAGVSYPSGLPGFCGLVEKIYEGLSETPDAIEKIEIKTRRFDTAIGLLEKRLVGGRATVRKELAKILTPDLSTSNATATHQAILTLAQQHGGPLRLITTNFDRLFEEARKSTSNITIYKAPLLPIPKNRFDGLIYLHGLLPEAPTSNDLDQLVLSSGDFGLAYLIDGWAARFVSELFRNYTVCFVGYSIDDPILRYMMDALAADCLLGESPQEMFAFGSYKEGEEENSANEWRAKNVTPILYQVQKNYDYSFLHETLRVWAETYRDGILGKERIVIQYAGNNPMNSTQQDDFVGRMLWALSDKSGIPAKHFANHTPVPPLEWLELFSELRFKYDDLASFRVIPNTSKDDKLLFSLIQRPDSHTLSPPIAFVSDGSSKSYWDKVMYQLSKWLCRHLDDPKLVLWIAKRGGQLHHQFASIISQTLKETSPRPMLQPLWHVLLSGRFKTPYSELNLYNWFSQFKCSGLTHPFRFQLREMLSPRLKLQEPRLKVVDAKDDVNQIPKRIKDLVDWEIVLNTTYVHSTLRDFWGDVSWREALPELLSDATQLLRDVLDLMHELGGADKHYDNSYLYQPSISRHSQNKEFYDWTALIDLTREAWLETAKRSPNRAQNEAESWHNTPYPLFRRLTFFAATHIDIIPPTQGLVWLLAEEGWWLWSIETKRETLRLLVTLAPKLDSDNLTKLEDAILEGPPLFMFKDDADPTQLQKIIEREIWVRLAKINITDAVLSERAMSKLTKLVESYPFWKLVSDERDEFPLWRGNADEWHTHLLTPLRRRELVEWVHKHPKLEHFQKDDWLERCKNDFPTIVCTLIELAQNNEWPISRWRDSLQVWSKDHWLNRSWRYLGPVLNSAPNKILKELAPTISYWLQAIAKTFETHESVFFSLIHRILKQEEKSNIDSDEDPVFKAINHPVGHVTEAALRWWYRHTLEDKQGLPNEVKPLFSQLCDTKIAIFQYGRVLLSTNIITLYRVDSEWTKQYLLPLFDWNNSCSEAKAAWEGFLWSPRLYPPLFEEIKVSFLETAKHYKQLGKHGEQYAKLLTLTALESSNIFTNAELISATKTLPSSALLHVAYILVQSLEAAGDKHAEYWRNRILPYWNTIWPKSRDSVTLEICNVLAQLCIVARNEFPNALKAIQHWLQPIDDHVYLINLLCNEKLPERFPRETLEFLSIIMGKRPQWIPPDLKVCLDTISRAEPALASENHYKRLVEYLE